MIRVSDLSLFCSLNGVATFVINKLLVISWNLYTLLVLLCAGEREKHNQLFNSMSLLNEPMLILQSNPVLERESAI